MANHKAVNQFKSIRRARKRGHLSSSGEILPSRPFNNSKRTKGREFQTVCEQKNKEVKLYLRRLMKLNNKT